MFSNAKQPPETSEIAAPLESRASSLLSWTVAVLGSGHLALALGLYSIPSGQGSSDRGVRTFCNDST